MIVNYDMVDHLLFHLNLNTFVLFLFLFLFKMISPAKRLCSSSTSLIRCQWHPIVDDDYLRLPKFQSMIVARIKDRRLTSDILPLINKIYPWPNSLKHVRRIHQNNNNLDIILYPSSFVTSIDKTEFDKYFENETRLANIPETPCLLKWQYDLCIKENWPNLVFRENKILEKSQLNKDLTETDDIILDLLEVFKLIMRIKYKFHFY